MLAKKRKVGDVIAASLGPDTWQAEKGNLFSQRTFESGDQLERYYISCSESRGYGGVYTYPLVIFCASSLNALVHGPSLNRSWAGSAMRHGVPAVHSLRRLVPTGADCTRAVRDSGSGFGLGRRRRDSRGGTGSEERRLCDGRFPHAGVLPGVRNEG